KEVGRRGDVDFLVRVLTDVRYIESTGLAIERKAPRIAQPIGPDFRRSGRVACEGIVVRDDIAARATHIQPQQLGEQRVLVLAISIGIAATPAVARPYPQLAVGTELELAAVVIVVQRM